MIDPPGMSFALLFKLFQETGVFVACVVFFYIPLIILRSPITSDIEVGNLHKYLSFTYLCNLACHLALIFYNFLVERGHHQRMATINKLAIRGIRSFSGDDAQAIEYSVAICHMLSLGLFLHSL